MAVIAIDLGGTKLAGAIFRNNRDIPHRTVVALGGRQGRAVGWLIRSQVAALLELARARRIVIRAISVAVPGIVDSKTGKVWAPNIRGWEKYPLQFELESAFPSMQVIIESDRACYILGETWRGAAKNCRNAIFLAVGTGIGAGILIDGKILRGAHDIAGAIGWLALDRPFRREYIGCGCFEHHASGDGLAKIAKELLRRQPHSSTTPSLQHSITPIPHLSAPEIFKACDHGDPLARAVLAQAVEFWGMAVANLVSLFNPEKIIFGGGVFGPANRFLDDIYREAKKWAQPISIKQMKLHASKLGGDAGLYGAARLALTQPAAKTNEKG